MFLISNYDTEHYAIRIDRLYRYKTTRFGLSPYGNRIWDYNERDIAIQPLPIERHEEIYIQGPKLDTYVHQNSTKFNIITTKNIKTAAIFTNEENDNHIQKIIDFIKINLENTFYKNPTENIEINKDYIDYVEKQDNKEIVNRIQLIKIEGTNLTENNRYRDKTNLPPRSSSSHPIVLTEI